MFHQFWGVRWQKMGHFMLPFSSKHGILAILRILEGKESSPWSIWVCMIEFLMLSKPEEVTIPMKMTNPSARNCGINKFFHQCMCMDTQLSIWYSENSNASRIIIHATRTSSVEICNLINLQFRRMEGILAWCWIIHTSGHARQIQSNVGLWKNNANAEINIKRAASLWDSGWVLTAHHNNNTE